MENISLKPTYKINNLKIDTLNWQDFVDLCIMMFREMEKSGEFTDTTKTEGSGELGADFTTKQFFNGQLYNVNCQCKSKLGNKNRTEKERSTVTDKDFIEMVKKVKTRIKSKDDKFWVFTNFNLSNDLKKKFNEICIENDIYVSKIWDHDEIVSNLHAKCPNTRDTFWNTLENIKIHKFNEDEIIEKKRIKNKRYLEKILKGFKLNEREIFITPINKLGLEGYEKKKLRMYGYYDDYSLLASIFTLSDYGAYFSLRNYQRYQVKIESDNTTELYQVGYIPYDSMISITTSYSDAEYRIKCNFDKKGYPFHEYLLVRSVNNAEIFTNITDVISIPKKTSILEIIKITKQYMRSPIWDSDKDYYDDYVLLEID